MSVNNLKEIVEELNNNFTSIAKNTEKKLIKAN